MATIRKRRGKWQVQVRRNGLGGESRTFLTRRDAEIWARSVEAKVDKGEIPFAQRRAKRYTFKHILERYRDEITPRKRSAPSERYRTLIYLTRRVAKRRH